MALGLGTGGRGQLHEAVDWLGERQRRIERRLAKGGEVLHDVSGSYYEGCACLPVRFGHSRDGKRDRVDIADSAFSWSRRQADIDREATTRSARGSSRQAARALSASY